MSQELRKRQPRQRTQTISDGYRRPRAEAYSEPRHIKKERVIVVSEYDAVIFGAIVVLLLFGITMIFSSSYYAAMTNSNFKNNMFHFFTRQTQAVVLGFCIMLIAATVNYRSLKPFIPLMYIVANVLLVLVKLFGEEYNGAKRWLDLPFGLSFQPSEFAKVAVILTMAMYISGKRNRVDSFFGLLSCAAIIALPVGLVLWGKNLSTAIIITSIGAVMIFVSSKYFWPFVFLAGGAVAGLVSYLAFFADNYQGARYQAWLDPFAFPTTTGYQTIQSLFAVASGGLFGLGLGQSNQKLIYMPEPYNDFIFAIICEELGFFGAMIVLLMFAILIWRGIKIALSASDLFGTLIATGSVVLVGVQVIINVGVVTNTIPNTGIPMPFISYGGTSVMFILALMGVLLNISRYSKKSVETL